MCTTNHLLKRGLVSSKQLSKSNDKTLPRPQSRVVRGQTWKLQHTLLVHLLQRLNANTDNHENKRGKRWIFVNISFVNKIDGHRIWSLKSTASHMETAVPIHTGYSGFWGLVPLHILSPSCTLEHANRNNGEWTGYTRLVAIQIAATSIHDEGVSQWF